MKKPSKKNLIKKCSDLWSEIIRFKGYCEKCGKPESQTVLNAHHYISKNNKNLKFDLRNGVCLCVWCHIWSSESAHYGAPYFDKWFREYRTKDYEYLMNSKWRQTKTWYISDYEQILINLKEIYAQLEAKET